MSRARRHKRPTGRERKGHGHHTRVAEERLYGRHACQAVFATRPDDIQRVWLLEEETASFGEMLRELAHKRRPYHVTDRAELDRVARATHHEGVVIAARPPPRPSLDDVLRRAGREAAALVLLEGVGDPHNVGAILRVCAHFGVRAVLTTPGSARRSPALCRTAEGAAERVPLVEVEDAQDALRAVSEAGFVSVATSSHEDASLFSEESLPARPLLLFGAEGAGLSAPLLAKAKRRVAIPGTGAVESLNVACATSVILGEHYRRFAPR